jgi:orotate phosphoribosyltransferase
MSVDPALPARRGHFRLESGYHTDVWITLDALFTEPTRIANSVDRLADRLRRHNVSAVCGPFIGGAFLALLLSQRLNVRFFYTRQLPTSSSEKLFTAKYQLPTELQRQIAGAHVAIVDDMISAGSSVRATMEAVQAASATVDVVGCLTVLGTKGKDHFRGAGVPFESVDAQALNLFHPDECPLCASDVPLESLE